ncbi:DUF389 domain-containing protein [Psychrobacter sp. FDAARGOS_221]|uniref:DUF389 domain-containing protein n=1 Tax=Psychrobacter sp. FDAARGOS_221 TaxID=1975705 RepID=UPI000BB58326|nr:DUF389 domain-containing protein [Psychrobacter sp. FDAARGOS_221]PNK59968.1 DUF389 domain-containing protein [Psychrobacter sp. FDAARGOS_221]
MAKSTFIPVPYFQFVEDATTYDLTRINYKPVPNEKIHWHCPFVVIDATLINKPFKDIAIAAAAPTPADQLQSPDVVQISDIAQTDNPNAVSSDASQPASVESAEQQSQSLDGSESQAEIDPEAAEKEKQRLDFLAQQEALPYPDADMIAEDGSESSANQNVAANPEDGLQQQSDVASKNGEIAEPQPVAAQDPDATVEVAQDDNQNQSHNQDDAQNEIQQLELAQDKSEQQPVQSELEQAAEQAPLSTNLDSDALDSDSESNTEQLELASDEQDLESIEQQLDKDQEQDDEDEDEDEKLSEEEKEKKEKEAKLESYKQFVAEQKSKVDVDYQGIRVDIEANALPSRMYFIMNALSAIIASYGLVINSAAVVIGAMLVAMMLGPISGVALAIIDYRMPFLRKSLVTVLSGGAMVVLIGFVVGLTHQDTALSQEILSRTQPTSMDLMIALAGGTAGAYAMISPHLSVAVVGVAVATALVPPLAASGILFAHGEGSLGLGALLLAITNIIAIQFTNALVLWFTGFRRLVEDDYKSNPMITFFRRNAVPLLLLTVIGGYLSYNLHNITKKQTFENEVEDSISQYFADKGNTITSTQFVNREDHQTVRAVMHGETEPTATDVQQIENQVNEQIQQHYPDYQPVRVQLRYMPVKVVESSPNNTDEISKTDATILSTE